MENTLTNKPTSWFKNEAKELAQFLIFVVSLYTFIYLIHPFFLYTEHLFVELFYGVDTQTAINMINDQNKQNEKMYSSDLDFLFLFLFLLKPIALFEIYLFYRIAIYVYAKYELWCNQKNTSCEIQTISRKKRWVSELKILLDFVIVFIVFNMFFAFILKVLVPTDVKESEEFAAAAAAIFFIAPFALYTSYRMTKIIRRKLWRRFVTHDNG